jgi:hypothetical protein
MTEKPNTPKLNALNTINDADMAAFVGKNWVAYEPSWNYLKKTSRLTPTTFFKSFNWMAALVAPVWFLYRKMYISLAVYLAFGYGLSYIIDTFNLHINLTPALAGAMGVCARWLYLQFSASTIKKIRASTTGEEDAQLKLAKAGGVSVPGAVLGAIIVAALIAMLLYDNYLLQNGMSDPLEPTSTISDSPLPTGLPVDKAITQ